MMSRILGVSKAQELMEDSARAGAGTVSGRIGRDIVLMPH